MEIPALISDLAVMMLTAGVITILFKKLKQPLVLGYILAGFLISPYFPFYVTVVDTASIETWSEIGIIFLMFHLGLEFNLHKLAQVGSTAFITVIVEVAGIMLLGFTAGQMLRFGRMDSIFLGGMLCISSTTIIIKAFDELNLRKRKFTELVFGTLVVEDIVGIFMMVILSTISVSQNISGGDLAGSLLLMIFYLVAWLVLGIYFLPTFLNKTIKLMNDEMLLIVSAGFCFTMVLLANALGFSSALGAFLAGSFFAGTVHVERISQLTNGVKDLFGAVFFLSVGMMVDPSMLVEYIVPVLVITGVVITGKLVFPSLGMLLSGQTLENSIQCGFSMAQIGEFAFIIASLGTGLGVTGDFLYPVVVSVSVITTFTTPMFIRSGPRAASLIKRMLPEKWDAKLNRYTSEEQIEKEQDNEWYLYLKKYFFRIVVYGGIMLSAAVFSVKIAEPFLAEWLNPLAGELISTLGLYLVIAVFVRPLLNLHNNLFTSLWLKRISFRLPLLVFNLIKIGIVAAIAMIPLRVFFNVHLLWLALIMTAVLLIFSRNSFISTWYLQLETRFLRNFNERIIEREEREGRHQLWLDRTLYIISFIAPKEGDFLRKKLEDLNWGSHYNVYVVKIRHNGRHIILPKGRMEIHPGDKVFVMGEEKALLNFYALTGLKQTKPMRTLKEFMASDYPDVENALAVCAIKIKGDEFFAGKSIRQSNIREGRNCLIIGLQKDGYPIIMPDPDLLLGRGDILWLMGSNNAVGLLASEYVEEEA